MTTTKKYDHLNRLLDISSVPSAASAVKFSYAYNDSNQRTRRTDSDDSYWGYEYDSLGQVTSGKHYWPDATPIAGQQFEYAYDDIGNRRRTREGGDASGSGLRTAHYTVNNLNQYTERTVPGAADIIGIAYPFAPVTVNDQSTYRRGEYYHKELAIDNSSAPVWQAVTNQATYTPSATNTTTGNLLLPKTPQTLWYDDDGNMLSDFVWTNSWDGENHMAATETTTAVPNAGRAKETWSFDAEGRWVQRVVFPWSGGTYAPQYTNRLLWQGKMLAAVLDQNNALVMSFLRGLDLSGTVDIAGGAGGLLLVNIPTNGVHFCAYDANGNVAALMDSADGTTSGVYEYDPFGRSLRVTGTAAKANPFRYSTQFWIELAGIVKYLNRDYQVSLGRWISLDPVSEAGGKNLYNFVENSPANLTDMLGLSPSSWSWDGGGEGELKPSAVDKGGTQTSVTGTAIVSPAANLLPGCNGWVIDTAGTGSISWFYSSPKVKIHEKVHVNDRTSLFNDYKIHALAFENRCFCIKPPADCLAKLIEGTMSDLYLKRGDLKAAAWDCIDYPEGSAAQKAACAEEKALKPIVDKLQAELTAEIAKCARVR